MLHQHSKLIASKPRQCVALPDFVMQYTSELAQQLIARHMTARVIDYFKLVKIQVTQGVLDRICSGGLQSAL
jgi:hypothetical protein